MRHGILDAPDSHMGEDLKTGEKYGGPNGAKIPPQVIVAFMMVHDATWQTVTSKKRGRGS